MIHELIVYLLCNREDIDLTSDLSIDLNGSSLICSLDFNKKRLFILICEVDTLLLHVVIVILLINTQWSSTQSRVKDWLLEVNNYFSYYVIGLEKVSIICLNSQLVLLSGMLDMID